jgi:hypothetical protein
VCVQEPCVYLLSAASVVIRNKSNLYIFKNFARDETKLVNKNLTEKNAKKLNISAFEKSTDLMFETKIIFKNLVIQPV